METRTGFLSAADLDLTEVDLTEIATAAEAVAVHGNRYPALTVAHPNGGTKEQVAGRSVDDAIANLIEFYARTARAR